MVMGRLVPVHGGGFMFKISHDFGMLRVSVAVSCRGGILFALMKSIAIRMPEQVSTEAL
jgi:hypothetical protein